MCFCNSPFPQKSVKQALCLTGPSGCGKSTILHFFKQRYGERYSIYDFSGNYRVFSGYMTSLFGENIDVKIGELTHKSKVVFILDQFERFFFLKQEERDGIRKMIRSLCRENTGVIVSLREEYLADFLKQFDMNDLLAPGDETNVIPRGILREMVSIIENRPVTRSASVSVVRGRRSIMYGDCLIKNNAAVHLDTADPGSSRIVMEEMGATLLYCRNQNEMRAQLGGETAGASVMETKCVRLFGREDGEFLFRKHADEPLIEQQIIFHMAEFNQRILGFGAEELRAFIRSDNNELLGRYFDTQLASCGNYFHASRLLYLLSQARVHHLSVSTKDVENCLFPTLFDRAGHRQMWDDIRQLETLQLIRKNTENSDQEYEIAHDFIASAFLDYCATNMDRETKNALDLFITEYMDVKRRASSEEKIAHRVKVHGQRYYVLTTSVAVVAMIVTYLLQRFLYNPWTAAWQGFNPCGDFVSPFPAFITVISAVYLCMMYNSVVKYYRGRKASMCRKLYLLLMGLAWAAVFAYPHFLLLDGVDLSIAALNIALLLDDNHPKMCRSGLSAYGTRSCMIGLVFAAAHVFFFLVNRRFDDYLILTEYIMFTVLVAYAFAAHMTQEFLFARMTDAASEEF